MRYTKAATILACCLCSTNLLAQKADRSKVPDSFKSPVGQFRSGAGVPVDTIDLAGGRISVILKDDHTWSYIKNLSVVAQDSVFTESWDNVRTHAYSEINPANLPAMVQLQLVDSVSRFVVPYQRSVFSKFGWRRRKRHTGCDLPLQVGQPIAAAFDGRVRLAKYVSGYGNLIVIRHENGLETYYGHLSKIIKKPGEWVHAGDIIGLGGSTGRSTGPHLHFETRYKGQAFDPEWIIDFESGTLRDDEFLLKKTYFNPSVHYTEAALKKSREAQAVETVQAISKSFEAVKAKEAADSLKTTKQAEPEAQKPLTLTSGGQFHTIKSGETVGQVSRMYGISLDQVRRLNPGVNLDRVSIGQKIRISSAETKPAATVAANAPAVDRNAEFHSVKSGDTVSAIARMYGLSMEKIRQLNPGMNLDRISLGQKIRVKAAAVQTAPSQSAPAPQMSQTTSDPEYHIVKSGDTISSISKRYGVTIRDIQNMNPSLNVDRIGLGQKIRIR